MALTASKRDTITGFGISTLPFFGGGPVNPMYQKQILVKVAQQSNRAVLAGGQMGNELVSRRSKLRNKSHSVFFAVQVSLLGTKYSFG